MNAQLSLTAYPLGEAFCAEHPLAAEHIAGRARFENAKGRKARMSTLMEECLAKPARYGLVAKDGSIYGSNRNDWPEIARYLMESESVVFSIRRASCDAGATQATPVIA